MKRVLALTVGAAIVAGAAASTANADWRGRGYAYLGAYGGGYHGGYMPQGYW